MKVYGVGLPRTGTTSLAKALEILGYEVVHYCPITHPKTKELLGRQHEAYVSSEFLLRNWDLTKDMWILLHRPDWHISMELMGEDICEWQEHIKGWERLEKIYAPNILHFDISHGWEPLCYFLGKPHPNVPFPKLNTLP